MDINYLNSNQAVEDYAKLAFKAKGDVKKFQNDWRDILDDHGVTVTEDLNEDDILPKKIIGSIQDAIKQNTVFNQFHPVFNIEPGELVFDKDDHSAQTYGHKTNANKKLQQVTLQSRNIFPKAIYKLQRLDHMTFLKGGALVKWVLSELPRYVLNRVTQAILVGGVQNEDGTAFNAIYPIVGDELAVRSSIASNATADTLKKQLIKDVASLDIDNPTIFLSPSAWADLATQGDAWSVAMLTNSGLNIGGKLVKTSFLDDNHPYVIVDTNSYLVGFSGNGIETLSDFAITSNSEYIESRAYVAGSLMAPGKAIYAETGAATGK